MTQPAAREAAFASLVTNGMPPVPSEVRRIGCEHIADFVGVALGGASSEPAQIVTNLLGVSPSRSSGAARVWGGADWLPARDAALANALAGHVDDFDDDEPDCSLAHPTVTVLSAAAAACDLVPASGADLIDAYVAGIETLMRLGPSMNPAHYKRGFHATATLGQLGAVVSAGRILGLDADRMRHALGIAASLASGLRSNFGSHTKSLQTAEAARGGLMAAQLAQRGFTSTQGSLFGPMGFVSVLDGSTEVQEEIKAFGEGWMIASVGVTIKAYPCCTCTHTALDSLFALMVERPIDPDAVRRIEVDVDEAAPHILIHDQAATALEGKFSMPFCLAAGLLRGRLGVAEFDNAVVRDHRVRALMTKVTMRPDSSLPTPKGGISLASRLRISLADGSVLERYTEHPSGSLAHRLSPERLRAKFLTCAVPTLDEAGAAAAFQALLTLDREPHAARVFDRLCGPVVAPAARPRALAS